MRGAVPTRTQIISGQLPQNSTFVPNNPTDCPLRLVDSAAKQAFFYEFSPQVLKSGWKFVILIIGYMQKIHGPVCPFRWCNPKVR